MVFYVFDVLEVDGESTKSLPYVDRRATLDSLVEAGPRIQVPPYWTDVDRRQMLDIAREHGLEGVVAKRTDSIYIPGRRSPTWTKTPLRNNTEVVPIGWVMVPERRVEGSGGCCSAPTSLLAMRDVGTCGIPRMTPATSPARGSTAALCEPARSAFRVSVLRGGRI